MKFAIAAITELPPKPSAPVIIVRITANTANAFQNGPSSMRLALTFLLIFGKRRFTVSMPGNTRRVLIGVRHDVENQLAEGPRGLWPDLFLDPFAGVRQRDSEAVVIMIVTHLKRF